jgi:hypothetical protein
MASKLPRGVIVLLYLERDPGSLTKYSIFQHGSEILFGKEASLSNHKGGITGEEN